MDMHPGIGTRFAILWLWMTRTGAEQTLARSRPCLPSPCPPTRRAIFWSTTKRRSLRTSKPSRVKKALITFHTVAFEGSIGLVNILQALRLQRKGFKTTVLLYGPGVTLGVQRGFPKLGDEPFPGAQNFGNQLTKFMGEGGEIYCCRFALQMLYGHGEPSLLPGIRPISPLDVLDLILLHRRDGAFILNTWTL